MQTNGEITPRPKYTAKRSHPSVKNVKKEKYNRTDVSKENPYWPLAIMHHLIKQGCYQTSGAEQLRRDQFSTDQPTNIVSHRDTTSRLKIDKDTPVFPNDDPFDESVPASSTLNHRRMVSGIQKGRRRPQATRPVGRPTWLAFAF
jgi:hypothetical protein